MCKDNAWVVNEYSKPPSEIAHLPGRQRLALIDKDIPSTTLFDRTSLTSFVSKLTHWSHQWDDLMGHGNMLPTDRNHFEIETTLLFPTDEEELHVFYYDCNIISFLNTYVCMRG